MVIYLNDAERINSIENGKKACQKLICVKKGQKVYFDITRIYTKTHFFFQNLLISVIYFFQLLSKKAKTTLTASYILLRKIRISM